MMISVVSGLVGFQLKLTAPHPTHQFNKADGQESQELVLRPCVGGGGGGAFTNQSVCVSGLILSLTAWTCTSKHPREIILLVFDISECPLYLSPLYTLLLITTRLIF